MENRIKFSVEKGTKKSDFISDVIAFKNQYKERIVDGRIIIPTGFRAKVVEKNGKRYFIQEIALLGQSSIYIRELKDADTIKWCQEQGLL